MAETRLDEIVQMYCNVTGESKISARTAILSTPTGQAIANNDTTYLYDQPTNNLQAITQELSADIQKKFQKSVIIKAYHDTKIRSTLPSNEPLTAVARPEAKKVLQTHLKGQYAAKLKVTQRQKNRIMERILKNAD